MKMSSILTAAKQFLAKNEMELNSRYGYHRFLCHAVYDVGAPLTDQMRIRNYIQEQLNGYDTLEVWVAIKTRQDVAYVHDCTDKMQATRHAWVDSMIAELLKHGD